ncbi:histidine phosphatase family protein [Roseixanthobacter glucoisosaccharinicivorans]|uniref:histidine phosphatase family protein n=1 Tax=Roseixanthobacter glucoisosaccharinicivorans TaxID=3119923 RepID=UPI0037281FF8
MANRLTLICHGATAALRAGAFPRDEPLEPLALAQTQAWRGRLRRPDGVRTSPAERARETARALGFEAENDEDLRDWDCGLWAGRTFTEVDTAYPGALALWRGEPQAAPHGGESLAALIARMEAWLDRQREGHGHVIACTHAANVRAIAVGLLQAPPGAFWQIDVAPLTRSDLRTDGRRWTLRTLGQPLDPPPDA